MIPVWITITICSEIDSGLSRRQPRPASKPPLHPTLRLSEPVDPSESKVGGRHHWHWRCLPWGIPPRAANKADWFAFIPLPVAPDCTVTVQ